MLSAPAPFSRRRIPSSHHREEGWPSDQENIAQHPLSRGRGGVPIDGTRNTTPAASIRRLRAIFLVTSPPLLAVMRGGEFALFKMTPLNHHGQTAKAEVGDRNRRCEFHAASIHPPPF